MDNITHSLIGAQIGALLGRGNRLSARATVATAILAANLPDADLLYSSRISRPFGSLLHHRGFTHTVPGIVICALAAWSLILFLERRAGKHPSRRLVGWAAGLGATSHLILDWFNTYGVHPFWPLLNRWFYGDTLFIVEPMIWITLGFGTFYLFFSKIGRTVALLPVVGGLVLMPASGMVPWPIAAAFSAITLGLAAICGAHPGERKAITWICAAFIVGLIFAVSGGLVKDQMAEATTANRLSSFAQPSPSNPLCWSYLSMELDGEDIVYRANFVQPFANFFTIDCQRYALNPGLYSGADGVFKRVKVKELEQLSGNCRWQAFRRFARLPGVSDCPEGGRCTNDFRFARFRETNFSTLPLDGDCPTLLPPLDPPARFPWE
jgi:inner membrane protein